MVNKIKMSFENMEHYGFEKKSWLYNNKLEIGILISLFFVSFAVIFLFNRIEPANPILNIENPTSFLFNSIQTTSNANNEQINALHASVINRCYVDNTNNEQIIALQASVVAQQSIDNAKNDELLALQVIVSSQQIQIIELQNNFVLTNQLISNILNKFVVSEMELVQINNKTNQILTYLIQTVPR